MTVNPEIAQIQESQKSLAAEVESLTLQANQKREMFLKLQGILEYLVNKDKATQEAESEDLKATDEGEA
jgi:hypothetical protein